MKPEEAARKQIDAMLEAAGWPKDPGLDEVTRKTSALSSFGNLTRGAEPRTRNRSDCRCTMCRSMEVAMSTVTVSPKFQVVIPREVREGMKLKAGDKVKVFRFRNRLELVPVRGIASMRGFLKGIDTTVDRDSDRV